MKKRNFIKTIAIFSALFIMFFCTCKKNKPPEIPSNPTGPRGIYYGGAVYDFSVSTTDPDEDSISYQIDWGDGDTSDWSNFVASGTTVTMSKSWQFGSIYLVRARAQDEKDALSKWSAELMVNILANSFPIPSIITCPSGGLVGDTFIFTITAIDPDNDSIAIRINWDDGNETDWSSFVPSGDSVSISHSYSSHGNYRVKVKAKDSHNAISNWLVLDNIEIGKIEWTMVTDSAAWSKRADHSAVVFDNKIWILGGWLNNITQGIPLNDVWFSTDGLNWTCATESAAWSPRAGHTSVVFDSKIWVIGGALYKNDVWFSSDGINWTCATSSAGWSPRFNHSSVVYDNKIWVIGGEDPYEKYELNDVWYSTDGVNWICAINSALWSERARHTSVVFDNKIWLIGGKSWGIFYNDVWYSINGVNWIRITSSSGWSARSKHTSVVYDNEMWILGGNDYPSYYRYWNDVWYSKDGGNWTRALASGIWSERSNHASVVFNNKIWVLGGDNKNDVWYGSIVGIE